MHGYDTSTNRRVRVLVAKPGLDGHDRGAKVIAAALRDAGMEVIYTGLRANVSTIVAAAVQEDVDVIGLSILSGAHESICQRVMAALQAQNADIPVVVGGIIPASDFAKLKALGVKAVFGPESPIEAVVACVQQLATGSSPQSSAQEPEQHAAGGLS